MHALLLLTLDKNVQIVHFKPIGNAEKVDLETLKASLRIEHLGLYVNSPSNIADS